MSSKINSDFKFPKEIVKEAFSSIKDKETAHYISSLQLKKKMPTAQVTDPKDFFHKFNVDTSLIKEETVERLYSLIGKHVLSNTITFHDLFGLEFDFILENLQGHLSKEKWSNLRAEWRDCFLRGYYGLVRLGQLEGDPEITPITRQLFLLPTDYGKRVAQFSKKLEGELQETLKKFRRKPSLMRDHQEQIKLLMGQWEENRQLLTLFLIHRNPALFLTHKTINNCPGTHIMIPKDFEGVKETIQNLKRYVDLITSVKYQETELLEIRSDMQKLAEMENSDEILEKTKEMLDKLSRIIPKLSKKMEDMCARIFSIQSMPLPPDQIETLILQRSHLILYTCWAEDIRRILENSVQALLQPSAPIMDTYLNRLMLNFAQLFESKNNEASKEISILKKRCSEQFLSPKIVKQIFLLIELYSKGILAHIFIQTSLQDFLDEVEKVTSIALEELCKIDLSSNPIQNTLWASRLFILKNDLEVLLSKKEPNEEKLFPEKFLELLIAEDEVDPPTPPTTPPTPPSFRSSELKRPAAVKEPKPPNIDEILLSNKRRKIEKVLKALGMKSIRISGSHETWKGNGLQTVIPRHSELATGTLHKIHDQLKEQLDKKDD